MKKINSLLTGLLLTASVFMTQQAIAQAPQKMSYQSVIRNSSNALLANTAVGIQLSVLQGSASGTAVYVETQTATTNGNGLVSLQIGTGVVVTGSFADINWAAGPYFIKTETDPAGGSNYTITGTQEMLSVPYALYAETSGQSGALTAWSKTGNAGTVDGTNFIGTTDNVPLSIRVNNQKAGRIDPSNLFWGYQAGNSNISGYQNTAIGKGALYNNTTGYQNTANGFNALYSNINGVYNTANGYFALYSNTNGTSNTANGMYALYLNSTGVRNTANGHLALYSNTTGDNNTANGFQALLFSTGSFNTANGNNALNSNTTGNSNVAVGSSALYSNTTGARNVAIGESSLLVNTIGTQNTALGSEADVVTNALTNATAIGYGAKVDASNKIQLGNSSVTDVNTSGTYTAAGFKTPAGSSSQYLMADGSTSTGTVATTMGAIGGSSTANGGTITAGVLSLAPANGTNAGIVTTGSQTFAGSKTFSSPIKITAGSPGAGKVLTCDGNGVAFWANSGGVATAGPGISLTGTGTSIDPYVVSTKIYTIGLWPELGGYVFRISADGRHGLVAETQNEYSSVVDWWTANNSINNPICLSPNGQNFMDWRLPTVGELTEMYTQRVAIGGFGSSLFWSSTEGDANNAFRMDFSSGVYSTIDKNQQGYARAVRAF